MMQSGVGFHFAARSAGLQSLSGAKCLKGPFIYSKFMDSQVLAWFLFSSYYVI
jgi:hypothetical protein